MGDYGLKVSETGYDVKTAGQKNLAFNSGQNQFKIDSQGTFSVTVLSGNATGSTTITHSLGYVPACLLYLEETDSSGKKYRVPFHLTQRTFAEIGTSNIVVTVEYPIGSIPGTNKTHDGYYFIFKDNIT